ncbi:hypothetical protein D9M69_613280 [compost metagenome]
MPESGRFGVKTYHQVRGLFLFDHFQQRIGKTEYRTGVQAFGGDPRVLGECKMSPVDQGVGVKEE